MSDKIRTLTYECHGELHRERDGTWTSADGDLHAALARGGTTLFVTSFSKKQSKEIPLPDGNSDMFLPEDPFAKNSKPTFFPLGAAGKNLSDYVSDMCPVELNDPGTARIFATLCADLQTIAGTDVRKVLVATLKELTAQARTQDRLPVEFIRSRAGEVRAAEQKVAAERKAAEERKKEIAKEAFDNYRVLDNYLPAAQTAIWTALRELMREEGIHFPAEMVADYATFKREVEKLTTNQNQAHSLWTVYEFWKNRPAPPKDTRPVALLLYNTHDPNGGFNFPKINDPLGRSKQFRVIHREVKTEAEFHATIAAVRAETGAPIHTLVIAGHGNQTTLNLGADIFNETSSLDPNDFRQGDFVHFAKHLHPKGQLLLAGCSIGKGGKTGKNLANAFAKILPPTFQIYSTLEDANLPDVEVQPDLRLKVIWSNGKPYNTRGHLGERPKIRPFRVE